MDEAAHQADTGSAARAPSPIARGAEGPSADPDRSAEDGMRRLRILHLIVNLGHSNAQYNEHCLPMRERRDITICSFSTASVTVPDDISVFEGDGTVRGFLRSLERALGPEPYDVIHAHAPGTAALLLLTNLLHGRSMSNALLTVHNSRESFRFRNQLLLILLFIAYPIVVFCSNAARDSYPKTMRRLLRGGEHVVQNGVDTDRIVRSLPDPPPNRQHERDFHVISVGRLIPRKDPNTLLSAFALACGENDRLTYVGDGHERTQLLQTAQRNGLRSRVSLAGALARDDVYRQLAQADLFVSTSRGEGLPVAVLEAMACARPVVISDIPPHREIAAAGDFVRLVAPGDALAFAREMRRYRAMPASERARIGTACRDLVTRHFGLDLMNRSYQRIYEKVVTRAGASRGARPSTRGRTR